MHPFDKYFYCKGDEDGGGKKKKKTNTKTTYTKCGSTPGYTPGRFLNDLKKRFGGIDSLLMWPVYPMVGVDRRNIINLFDAMPGGRGELRKVIQYMKTNYNVTTLLPMLPWAGRNVMPYYGPKDPFKKTVMYYSSLLPYGKTEDGGDGKDGELEAKHFGDALYELIEDVGAKGFNGDCMENPSYGLIGENNYGTSKLFNWSTSNITDSDSKSISTATIPIGIELESTDNTKGDMRNRTTMGWNYLLLENLQLPPLDAYKWLVDARHVTHSFERWHQERILYILYTYFTGSGFNAWENVWGIYNKYTDFNAEMIRRSTAIKRFFGNVKNFAFSKHLSKSTNGFLQDQFWEPFSPDIITKPNDYSKYGGVRPLANIHASKFSMPASLTDSEDREVLYLIIDWPGLEQNKWWPLEGDEAVKTMSLGGTATLDTYKLYKKGRLLEYWDCYSGIKAKDQVRPTVTLDGRGIGCIYGRSLSSHRSEDSEDGSQLVFTKFLNKMKKMTVKSTTIDFGGTKELIYENYPNVWKVLKQELRVQKRTPEPSSSKDMIMVSINPTSSTTSSKSKSYLFKTSSDRAIIEPRPEWWKVPNSEGGGYQNGRYSPLSGIGEQFYAVDPSNSSNILLDGSPGKTEVTGPQLNHEMEIPIEDTPTTNYTYVTGTLRPFLMDVKPVTISDYYEYLELSKYTPPEGSDHNFLNGDDEKANCWVKEEGEFNDKNSIKTSSYKPSPSCDTSRPVTNIGWQEAEDYCRYRGARLPHSYEWQYVAEKYIDEVKNDIVPGCDLPKSGDGEDYSCISVSTDYKSSGADSQNSTFIQLTSNIWHYTADVFEDDHTRFVLLKGGSRFQATGSAWFFRNFYREGISNHGGNMYMTPDTDMRTNVTQHQKYFLFSNEYERNEFIGFRCVVDGVVSEGGAEEEERRIYV